MKTSLSALVALLVIAGAAGTASALDAKTFFEQNRENKHCAFPVRAGGDACGIDSKPLLSEQRAAGQKRWPL